MVQRGIGTVLALAALTSLAGCFESNIQPKSEDGQQRGSDIVSRDIPPLTAAQIEIFLRNSTLSHRGNERVWHVFLQEGGALIGVGRVKGGGQERTRGRWEVRPDGYLCRQWDNDWGGGQNGCAQVYQYGTEFVFVPEDGGAEFSRRRTPGDSAGVI